MQGGRGRGDPFFNFGDPFPAFGGMPSLFGGRDPFDDPFFTQPFGGMLQPNPPFMGVSPFGSSLFGPTGSPFMDPHPPRIYNHTRSLPNSSRGPIIQELNSDDETEEPEAGHGMKDNHYKHRQPHIEHPYDGTQAGREVNIMHDTYSRPQAHSFSFQSSSVTYGGSNGAYYTSSTTRRAGSDGVRYEEHKEADSVSGKAAHRISRGIHEKGHTVSRHLKSDGHVDTMQMLHNINEDELSGFEEAWKGKARNDRGGHNVGALPWSEKRDAGGRRRLGAGESSMGPRRH